MTRQEYDALQRELSDLLEAKKDVYGRKLKRPEGYKEAVLASKSVLHNWFLFRNKEGEQE